MVFIDRDFGNAVTSVWHTVRCLLADCCFMTEAWARVDDFLNRAFRNFVSTEAANHAPPRT